jgi:hypothetical protein
MPQSINPDDLPQDIKSNITSDDDNTISPARQDEEWKENPESDDDVDDLGKKIGITYEQGEELNIEEKFPFTTESEAPDNEPI